MKKINLAQILFTSFKVLTYTFGVLGVVTLILIFVVPDVMFIGIQGLNICSGDLSIEDRIIVSCFVAVTVFLSVISAKYLAGLFKLATEKPKKQLVFKQLENGGYVAMAWGIYSAGEKLSMPFFTLISGAESSVRPYFGESILILLFGLFLSISCFILRKQES